MTGIHEFDDVLHEANVWLKAVMAQLKTEDARVGWAALKACLHVLRDRIPPDNAVHLGDQLPTVIRGIYYENWHLTGKPTKERHLEPFLERVRTEIPQGIALDPEDAACAVFQVLSTKLDDGEIAKVIRILPLELRDLWPVLAQLDATPG